MEWLFVMKDRGTHNAGYWLKISSVDELVEYIKITNPTRYGKAFENYVFGKDYGEITNSHGPHLDAEPLTQAIVRNAQNMKSKYDTAMNIFQAIESFSSMVAMNILNSLQETGAIYINRVGGYHGYYKDSKENGFVRRKELVFPDFKKDEIRIKKFSNGEHYYAYIDDMQVRDGDTLKWNTYEEAYKQAISFIEEGD